MHSFFNKLRYYADLHLHLRILSAIAVIWFHRHNGYYRAIPPSMRVRLAGSDPLQSDQLRRYCNLWLSIRAKLGLRDACYFKSTLHCRILRCAGIDARINFGTMPGNTVNEDDWQLIGHCWVSTPGDLPIDEYPFTIQYPSGEAA